MAKKAGKDAGSSKVEITSFEVKAKGLPKKHDKNKPGSAWRLGKRRAYRNGLSYKEARAMKRRAERQYINFAATPEEAKEAKAKKAYRAPVPVVTIAFDRIVNVGKERHCTKGSKIHFFNMDHSKLPLHSRVTEYAGREDYLSVPLTLFMQGLRIPALSSRPFMVVA